MNVTMNVTYQALPPFDPTWGLSRSFLVSKDEATHARFDFPLRVSLQPPARRPIGLLAAIAAATCVLTCSPKGVNRQVGKGPLTRGQVSK